MDDVAAAQSENENLRKIRERLMKWEAKENALASLSAQQEEYLESLTSIWNGQQKVKSSTIERNNVKNGFEDSDSHGFHQTISSSLQELQNLSEGIENTSDFLVWYDRVHSEIHHHADDSCYKYLEQLKLRSNECSSIVYEIDTTLEKLETLHTEYAFVANKTSALNTASEQLIEEQEKLQQLSDEIQRRLHYFNQVELLHQRLQSPTLSVASESFQECLNKIDECLEYLKVNPKFKDSNVYITKYNQCLSKALSLIKNYVNTVMSQATEATLHPKPQQANVKNDCANTSSDIVFALYYGKYQTTAAKIKRISALVEERIHVSPEYEHLLNEIQQNYLIERVAIMSPAVDKAIKDLKALHKSDHCTLMRSACAFLVHVCQDEHRLFLNFFSIASEQLTSYLEGLCTILYDTMRPFIIHINHLETLAEICSIVRIEMIEEHVQQNPEPLAAFASTANQLLQDVQERLVFRAHLYLQSDILNYNPSAGDLAYPEKLEMMESIAMSLQESAQLRRSDSRSSLISSASSVIETESIDTAYRARNINSPADLHGMWYPTVRRTLVCLSRLYRCVDRPIFQGLSQDALRLCIQSVSAGAAKITSAKTSIDGYLFEIKHLLILREQIAPFRVDFTVKETSLDFSKVKTAAFGLLQKRKQLFSMGSNNALLEFLLEGTPQIKEHLVDSRKEVDRQLKTICEEFIRDAAQMLVGPISTFLDRAQTLLAASETSNDKDAASSKVNYALRQTSWAAPQQISSVIQETQRLIKSKLPLLQRSMQLYLSNRDTEYIILRPIRNNIIQAFVKLEHLLITNGYTSDDMIVTSCPSAEQVSILLSSASILAAEGIINFSAGVQPKISTSSNEGASISNAPTAGALHRKVGYEKKLSFENPSTHMMENLLEVPESGSPVESPATMSPVPPQDSISCELGT